MPVRPAIRPGRLLPAAAWPAAALTVALGACGQSDVAPPVSTPSPTARPLQACSADMLPETGFTPDAQHSGVLNVGKYNPNGDIEAALIYYKFETGIRQIYTDIPASPAPTAAAAGPPAAHDELVICDALSFAKADGAKSFVTSFRQLRIDQHQTVDTTAAHVGDASVAIRDHDQSFIGYAIQGASGVEAAASSGDRFYSVSVFGPSPQLHTAQVILAAMMGANR